MLAAAANGMEPAGILLTHHHGDHIGGVAELRRHWPDIPVFAPHDDRIPFHCSRVGDGEPVSLAGWTFQVLPVPGHTTSHVAYVGHGRLFCGDTLFSLGCGRMFEGTAPQMLASLKRLASLPADLLVCCGHEYTLANAAFARQVDPTNAALQRRQLEVLNMRRQSLATVPVPLATELATNPFLRTREGAVIAAVEARLGRPASDEAEVFAELRRWKDGFAA